MNTQMDISITTHSGFNLGDMVEFDGDGQPVKGRIAYFAREDTGTVVAYITTGPGPGRRVEVRYLRHAA